MKAVMFSLASVCRCSTIAKLTNIRTQQPNVLPENQNRQGKLVKSHTKDYGNSILYYRQLDSYLLQVYKNFYSLSYTHSLTHHLFLAADRLN